MPDVITGPFDKLGQFTELTHYAIYGWAKYDAWARRHVICGRCETEMCFVSRTPATCPLCGIELNYGMVVSVSSEEAPDVPPDSCLP